MSYGYADDLAIIRSTGSASGKYQYWFNAGPAFQENGPCKHDTVGRDDGHAGHPSLD